MTVIENHLDSIKSICAEHYVDKLYLFGSALSSRFNNQSDLDFLVKFQPVELSEYFNNYLDLKNELSSLFGRDIDLLEEQALKNPILIESINNSKELVYG